jgi:coproporphyrinogen III oxidase-like Fe-S oxidoreductase
LFSARTGLPLGQIQPQLDELEAEGWIQLHEDHLQVTPHGQTYLNSLIERFLNLSSGG